MRCHGKRKSNIHPTRITLHRRIQKFLHLRKCNDLVKFAFYFSTSHSKDSAVEEDVFAASQLLVKSGADFQKARHPSLNLNPATGRLRDSTKDLQEGTFAGTVSPNDADHFTLSDLAGNIFESPEIHARPRLALPTDSCHRS